MVEVFQRAGRDKGGTEMEGRVEESRDRSVKSFVLTT